MTRLRSILFWCHLSGGVGAGLVIFVMCATGAILSMKPQVLSLVDRQVRFVDARNTPRLPPSQIIAAVTAREPGAQPMSFSENRDPGAAAAVGLAGNDTVYVDPYNAAVLGHGSTRAQAFFRSAEDWHRWLAVSGDNRATARWATDAATLVFCALAVSGLCLWWPGGLVWFRRTGTARARDFNWHNVVGFWSSSVILVMTLSGIVMAYPWANSLLYHLAGSPVPQQNSQHGNGTAAGRAADQRTPASVKVPRALDAMWARAEETMPTWSAMSVRFSARGPVAFTLTDGAYWNAFARSQLTLDATNADVVRWEPYSETSAGQKARGWIRFAHTGELGGWPLQLAAGLACIGGMFLVWTGWSLAIRRWLSTATTTRRARPSDRKAA